MRAWVTWYLRPKPNTPLNHVEDYRHLLDCLMCVYLNFALREWDFVPDVHKKVYILLPLVCDLNLVKFRTS